MKFVFTLCSLLFTVFASAHSYDSLRSEQRAEGLIVIHQVEKQETLYSIARRYGGSVPSIIERNEIQNNTIDIGQVIEILVEKEDVVTVNETKIEVSTHKVEKGQTLYSIAQQYGVRLSELKELNDLKDNAISIDMILKLGDGVTINQDIEEQAKLDTATLLAVKDSLIVDTEEIDPYEDFEKYLVQTGETLYTIATKIGVRSDSIKRWNALSSDHLMIGQRLYYIPVSDTIDDSIVKRGKSRTRIDEDGFERVFEEGVASVIESMETSKFLALHRSLPIGTNLEVRNLMNNQVVHVKVVGRLPKTGLNRNLLIRVSQSAYDQLRILDPKSRVEVSYFK